jgi:hypothetical protein
MDKNINGFSEAATSYALRQKENFRSKLDKAAHNF